MWGVMSESEDFPSEGRGLTPRVFEKLFARIDEVCKLLPFKSEALHAFDDWIDYPCGGSNRTL